MSATPEAMAEDAVNIEINGVPLVARKGDMIIHAADDANISIPRFCYHKKLPIAANCRMCLVEVEKVPKPLPACATPVAEGMKVFTHSARAIAAQRGVMEFLLINHPLDCPICDQGGECELQDVAMGFGRGLSRFTEGKRIVKDKDLGPLISTEMTRCIHCTRCIRTLELVAGQKELGATGRGENTRIGTYIERSVDSEMSGNVIDVCPVGALTSKPFRFKVRAWEVKQKDGVAPHDCLGSNVHVHTYHNHVMRVVPRENEAINEVWLSDRDRFAYEGLNSEDRLIQPMIKIKGSWQETDWITALDTVVEGLNNVIKNDGPEQVGTLVSPNATLEEMYLMQKLMRGLGVANIDHRLRQLDFTDDASAPVFPWFGQSIEDIDQLQAALVIGSNIRKEQPVAAHRLRKAATDGASIMFVNPVDYEFNLPVSHKIITDPDNMITELAGIAYALHHLTGGALPAEINTIVSGVAVNDNHRTIARHLHENDRSIVILGTLAHMHPHFSHLRALASVIASLSSARFGYLPGGGNSAGAWLSGLVPHRGLGGAASSKTGLNTTRMISNHLKAYILFGVEPEFDCASPKTAIDTLKQAEFVLSLASHKNKQAEEYADVLLPVAPYTETTGTFINVEGCLQSFDAAVSSLAESRDAWKVLRVLANMCDLDEFEYVSAGEVRDEAVKAIGDIKPDNSLTLTSLTSGPQHENKLVRISEVPIYAVDPIVRRAGSLQQTKDAVATIVHVNEMLARQRSLGEEGRVNVRQEEGDWVSLPFVIDNRVPDNCVLIPSGIPGSEHLGPAFGNIEIEKDTETSLRRNQHD